MLACIDRKIKALEFLTAESKAGKIYPLSKYIKMIELVLLLTDMAAVSSQSPAF
jgi:hypothetical protein